MDSGAEQRAGAGPREFPQTASSRVVLGVSGRSWRFASRFDSCGKEDGVDAPRFLTGRKKIAEKRTACMPTRRLKPVRLESECGWHRLWSEFSGAKSPPRTTGTDPNKMASDMLSSVQHQLRMPQRFDRRRVVRGLIVKIRHQRRGGAVGDVPQSATTDREPARRNPRAHQSFARYVFAPALRQARASPGLRLRHPSRRLPRVDKRHRDAKDQRRIERAGLIPAAWAAKWIQENCAGFASRYAAGNARAPSSTTVSRATPLSQPTRSRRPRTAVADTLRWLAPGRRSAKDRPGRHRRRAASISSEGAISIVARSIKYCDGFRDREGLEIQRMQRTVRYQHHAVGEERRERTGRRKSRKAFCRRDTRIARDRAGFR